MENGTDVVQPEEVLTQEPPQAPAPPAPPAFSEKHIKTITEISQQMLDHEIQAHKNAVKSLNKIKMRFGARIRRIAVELYPGIENSPDEVNKFSVKLLNLCAGQAHRALEKSEGDTESTAS